MGCPMAHAVRQRRGNRSNGMTDETKSDGEWMDELIAIINTDGQEANDTELLEWAYALLQEWSQAQGGN